MRYTWGMHQHLRRIWRRRPRRVDVEIVAYPHVTPERPQSTPADPTAPRAYKPEPVDQDAPGWGPAPFKHA